jgi:hypothetical protein
MAALHIHPNDASAAPVFRQQSLPAVHPSTTSQELLYESLMAPGQEKLGVQPLPAGPVQQVLLASAGSLPLMTHEARSFRRISAGNAVLNAPRGSAQGVCCQLHVQPKYAVTIPEWACMACTAVQYDRCPTVTKGAPAARKQH